MDRNVLPIDHAWHVEDSDDFAHLVNIRLFGGQNDNRVLCRMCDQRDGARSCAERRAGLDRPRRTRRTLGPALCSEGRRTRCGEDLLNRGDQIGRHPMLNLDDNRPKPTALGVNVDVRQ